MLLEPVVRLEPAREPTAVFDPPLVKFTSAKLPQAELFEDVDVARDKYPKAELFWPAVFVARE